MTHSSHLHGFDHELITPTPLLHRPFVPAIGRANFKQQPSDFIVKEIMPTKLTGQGEHLWIYLCKVGMNTAFVAKLLAEWANIPLRDVGYSGLKDRHAKTYQWFSLRLPKRQLAAMDFDEFAKPKLNEHESLTVLTHHWHDKKLHRSTHKFNDFIITLRHLTGDKAAIDAQLALIRQQGVPNYVGQQRFGHDGDNLNKASLFFDKIGQSSKPYKPSKKDMDKHSLYLSGARSAMFNAMLSERVRLGTWNQAISGDVFNLDGSHSLFVERVSDEIRQRVTEQDIHPTAPLFGVGELKNRDESLALYQAIIHQEAFGLFRQGLVKVGVKMAYRPLRLRLFDLDWTWQDDTLTLAFRLPSGAFATSVLFVLCDELRDAHDVISDKSPDTHHATAL